MANSRFPIGLALLLSLLVLAPAATAASVPDKVRWSEISIPAEGEVGGRGLADDSDIRHLAMATDGTLYAYVTGLTYTLYKSTDGGYSWVHSSNVTDDIVDIVTSADDARVIYYASSSNIYKSSDAGESFQPLAINPAVVGGSNIEITSIDVARWDDGNIIVAGTRDTDAGEYGGVYLLKEQIFAQWLDTDIGDYDVYAVAFSPGFAYDQQIVAVATDETNSFVTTGMGDTGWGQTVGDARLDRDNCGASLAVSISADISFPDDYISDLAYGSYIQFVAVDASSDDGDVYIIYGGAAPGSSEAIDLNIASSYGLSNIDVTSLAISGKAATAYLMAGVADDGQVYHSYDGGASWERSLKEPTGQSRSYVLMAANFPSCGKAYAATSGTESALSATLDRGNTWNQLSMIDARIDNIIDLAISPDYSQDRSLFMLTWGGEFSLWRSLDGGALWQRVFASALGSVDSIDMVELSPRYGDGSQVVFLAGVEAGNPAIWKSDDNGQSFASRSASLPIDQWAIADDTTLFIAGYNGSNGLVYRTENSGQSYSSGAVVGDQSISCLALSPEYGQDGTILVGNSNGWIYWSDNNGTSFEPLPLSAISPPLTDNISVAFDPQFGSNSTVYTASDTPDGGIYRFTIGDSTGWENIDGSLPSGGMIGGLAASADGTLYAANFQQVDTENDKGGMERCLEPKAGTTFETVTRGLNNGATLFGLWIYGNQLWSIDTTNIKLMSYIDSLTQPVSLTWPHDQAPGMGTIISDAINDVSLDWETLDGATSYQWQLDDDNDFSSVPTGFEGNTTRSSVELPTLEPATTYYWRVRATKPVLSPWSDKWSFTTSLGGEIVAPRLESPQPGATEVAIKPIFQWSAVTGAESYELMVSGNLDFSNPVILRVEEDALPGNAWQSDVSLSYGTTYYWKVRALSPTTHSAWSAVGIFTTEIEASSKPEAASESEPNSGTEPPPETEPTLEPGTTPNTTTVSQTIATTTVVELTSSPTPLPDQTSPPTPDWVFYLVGSMGGIIMLVLAIILVLVIKRR
jgi:photosystem II stability/assembly factor-like uncharacterized protein